MFARNQLYLKMKFERGRYRIEPKQLTSCSTSMQKNPQNTWQSMPNMTNKQIILHKRPFWIRGTVLYYTWTLAQPARTESVSSRSLWKVAHSVQPVTAKEEHKISTFKGSQLSIMSFPSLVWHSVAGLLPWNPNQWRMTITTRCLSLNIIHGRS